MTCCRKSLSQILSRKNISVAPARDDFGDPNITHFKLVEVRPGRKLAIMQSKAKRLTTGRLPKLSMCSTPVFTNGLIDSDDEFDEDHVITVPVHIERPPSSATRVSLPAINSPSFLDLDSDSISKPHGKRLGRAQRLKKLYFPPKTKKQVDKSMNKRITNVSYLSPPSTKTASSNTDAVISEEIVAEKEYLANSTSSTTNNFSTFSSLGGRPIGGRRRFSTMVDDLDDVDTDVTVFFIHGVGGNSHLWSYQIKCLNGLGYSTVAFDCLGHGNSAVINNASAYHFDELKEDVLSVFDLYSTSQNVVIAHSYGCCFAAVLGRERRDKVVRLILLSCGAPESLEPSPGPFCLPVCVLSSLRCIINHNFVKNGFKSRPSSAKREMSFGAGSNVVKWILQGQHWVEGGRLYHSSVDASCLLVYGSDDGLVTLEEMQHMRTALPHARLVLIDHASHMLMIEQPEQVNQAIVDFLHGSGTVRPLSRYSCPDSAEPQSFSVPNLNVFVV